MQVGMHASQLMTVFLLVLPLPLLLSSTLLTLLSLSSPAMPELPPGPYPGDEVIPAAAMVYNQARLIHGRPSDVWPWVQQLGKGRGGWYATRYLESWLPKSWHSTRTINPEWQHLRPGDRVDDYGFSAEDYFIVSEVNPEKALIYKSDRYGAHFSWSILLHEVQDRGEAATLLHLRFRGRIAATGLKGRLIVWGGGLLDHWTTAPMLAGLAERVEKST